MHSTCHARLIRVLVAARLLGLTLPLGLTFTALACGADPLLGAGMAAAFRDPPACRRMLQIIHNFPDDPQAIDRRVHQLAARGFGGVVANVSFDDYLKSEAKWESFRAGVEAARKANLVVWLYDEQGYPSGAAGGLTLEGHPERVRTDRIDFEKLMQAESLLGPPAPEILLHAPAHVEKQLLALERDGIEDREPAREIETAPSRPTEAPVRAVARLLKPSVDTWCFLELRYPQCADLTPYRALELLLRTPEEQTGCAARLLMILLEENEDGTMAECIADTHSSLGLPGLRRTAIALSAFQLAGWSGDPDGTLDRSRIRAIRVGWGGYYGVEGERVTFDIESLSGLQLQKRPLPPFSQKR